MLHTGLAQLSRAPLSLVKAEKNEILETEK